MTEEDYIKATNRVKISAALVIVRDVLAGDDYGVSEADHAGIVKLLRDAEVKLFKSFELEAADDQA